MTSATGEVPHDPYAAFRLRNYRYFAAGTTASTIGTQMASVAIGWELYQRTNSATALGLVGLVQVLPVFLMSIPAGHVVDRHDRRKVVAVAQLVLVVSAISLGLISHYHDHVPLFGLLRQINHVCAFVAGYLGERKAHFDDAYLPVMYGLLCVNGLVRTFYQPAKSALMPQLIPMSHFANAVTWNSSLGEVCSMIGPTVGGGMVAILQGRPAIAGWAYSVVYFMNAGCQLGLLACLWPIHVTGIARQKEKTTIKSLLAGIGYVWRTKIILATMTLDMFAVILGGATALLPIFARDILRVGPAGLGWLRAAPSVGAFLMAVFIAHRPPMKRAGRNMLLGVAGFGLATAIFGLSRNFLLSFVMLMFVGAFDNISVVVRHTLMQVLTPDSMRGRVYAVNSIFVGSSDQLGSLESGVTAAMFGAVTSVVLGGAGAILVVLAAAMIWPGLRQFGAMEQKNLTESVT
jgi:MFS family permease